MRKFVGPLLLAFVAILAALSTIKYEQNPLVPGRDTGFRLCDSSCAFDDSLAFAAELGGDSTRLTLTVSSAQSLRGAVYSAYVGNTALGVRAERFSGDTVVVLAVTASPVSDQLFRWPPGALVRVAAYRVDSVMQPAVGARPGRPGTAAPRVRTVRRTPLPLRVKDWRLATSGSTDDSLNRAKRRDVARTVYAVGLVGLLISAGVAAARSKPDGGPPAQASTAPLSVEECIKRLIEEIGAHGGPDGDKKVLILRATVLGTMPNEELLRTLSTTPPNPLATLRLIKETRDNLVGRVRTLAARLEDKAADLDPPPAAGAAPGHPG